jgi:hypothetical protein
METMKITCPSCKKQYNVYVDSKWSFNCSDCQVKVKFDSKGNSEIFKEPAPTPTIDQSISVATIPTNQRGYSSSQAPQLNPKIQNQPPLNNPSREPAWASMIYWLVVIFIVFLVIDQTGLYDFAKGKLAKQEATTSFNNSSDVSHSVSKEPHVNSTVSKDTKSKTEHRELVLLNSLIDSLDVKFNDNFEPIATIKLHNKTSKEIKQVVIRFDYFIDDGTKVWRAMYQGYTSYSKLDVSIKPGEFDTETFPIPLTEYKQIDTPQITVIKARYADGSISTDYR